MTRKQYTKNLSDVKATLSQDEDFLRTLVQALVQETMEGEMDECLGAGRYMRTDQRLGYRSGYYSRNLLTRVRLILIPPMPGHHTPPSR